MKERLEGGKTYERQWIRYRRLRGYKYRVAEAVSFDVSDWDWRGASYTVEGWVRLDGASGILEVAAGYAWDGPSGPALDTASLMRGSLAHDALYQLHREASLPIELRRQSDEVLRTICLEDGMSPLQAWCVFQAVRICAAHAASPQARGRHGAVRTAPLLGWIFRW